MPTSLCIQVSGLSSTDFEEIKFFESGEWDSESEKNLLIRIGELVSILRHVSKSVQVNIRVEAKDISEALFLIRKKTTAHFEINNQKLSIREIEVLGLIMQGLTNHEIAEKLFISYETVKSHRKNILEKSGARNTAALINYYHQTFFEK